MYENLVLCMVLFAVIIYCLHLMKTTKKKYRRKDNGLNTSMSTISINSNNTSTLNLDDSTVVIPPPPATSRASNQMEVHDLSSWIEVDEGTLKTYKFQYTFNEYLRLFLIKLLPLKEKDMTILYEEKTLKGPEAKCEKLIKNIKNQIEKFAVKIVKFKEEADIEEIQFHLQSKYDLKIFRKKYLKLATKDMMAVFPMAEPANLFLCRIQQQQIILLRVEKKKEKECLQEIQSLVTGASPEDIRIGTQRQQKQERPQRQQKQPQKQQKQPQKRQAASSSGDQIVEDEDEPTYYQSQNVNIRNTKSDFKQFSHANFKKMEEPTEDDSVSVVQERKYNNRRKREKVEEREREHEREEEKEMRLIKEYDFDEFDKKAFEGWLRNNRILTSNHVKILTKTDPYDDTYHTYIVQLLSSESNSRRDDELIEALQAYLKFRKVIIIKLQNDKYRDQLVQKYERDENGLSIAYVKGYKSPKWPQAQMWKLIVKKAYSDVKKTANTEYFQVFFLEGLKNLVLDMEQEIKQHLQTEPKDDVSEELLIKLDELSDHIRNHQRLKDLIKDYVKRLVSSTYSNTCQVINVEFPISTLKVTLKVKIEQQDNFQKTVKGQIIDKVQKEIKIRDYLASFKIDRHTFDKLEKVAIITHREERSFKYVSSMYNLEDVMHKINQILNAQNSIVEKELLVTDKIIAKKVSQYLAEIISKQSEYSQIKHNYMAEQSKFKFYGRENPMELLIAELQVYVAEVQEKRITYFQIAKKKEGELLQKDNILADIEANHDIIVNVNKSEMPCKLIVSNYSDLFKKKNILIIKSKSLDYAPCGSVIVFRSLPEVDLFKGNYFMKTFRNYINKHKTDTYSQNTRRYSILMKTNQSVSDALTQALAVNPNPANHVIMIMPETGKEAFVKAIIKELHQNKAHQSRDVTIMIIQYGQSADLLKQLNISPYAKGKKLQLKDQTFTKYYVEDKGTKFYYSDNGNRKILMAKQKGFSKIILNNEDLNIAHISHQYYTQNQIMIHLQSHKQFAVKIVNTKVEFVLKNQTYEMPQAQIDIVFNSIRTNVQTADLSLGVYQIDLTSMMQTNLFSDYQRKLHKQEKIIKADMNQELVQAFYNVKIAQIEYSYYFDEVDTDNFDTARKEVANFLQGHVTQMDISYKDLKNIQSVDLEGIKTAIEQDEQTEFTYSNNTKTISLRTLDETTLNRCKQLITMLLNNLNERDPHKIKYPAEWEPQKEEIETILVNRNTQQFAKVQAMFTTGQIKSLHRIQNKIIYKKYFQQSVFLESMNGGKKVKTMQLFHGTRTTNPEEIYKDKQESFNINYSSDNNLLGKGIYFAEKSEYSDSYKYTEVVNTGTIFGMGARNQYSMFLCQVLVGQSQKCLQHNGAIKDTKYRDENNKIKFESMTDFLNNSNIFVVYKSRRAYPLYLIKY